MPVALHTILKDFPDLLKLERGSAEASFAALKDPSEAGAQDLIFLFGARSVKDAASSRAQAWVVQKDLLTVIPAEVPTVISSPNAQLALARVARKYFAPRAQHQPIAGPRIHPGAHVATTAKLGEGCLVGPGAVIGESVELGDHCIIGANTVLEPGVKIGARTYIHPLVFIAHGCEVGADCEIHPHTTIGSEGFGYAYDAQFNAERLTHFGRVILEDHVHVGAGVQIDRGTFLDSRIGARTKIDNHSHFGHNIRIGRNTIIAGGLVAAGSATIGNYCVIGGRSTVGGHLEIPDKTKISGASVVGKTISEAGEYGGFPLQSIQEALKTRVAMRNLPRLLKQVRRITKHLGLKEEE